MDEVKANSFLNMIRRSQRGRLKVYLGYCPGVGKTYRMLQEAHILKSEGIDVVVGYVETHGRSDIAKLLEGLEIIPRIVKEYRGIQVEEMDVDAVLTRKPAVALVDEIAHTNVPGSRNRKRYQDIQEILAAGIHVITTLNIQHLESLYDTVEKLVKVKVRERLPDTIISEADQIVNVDLSTEDLRKRLKEGKVYSRDKIDVALENFFVSANLENLRELTLRELAAQIDFRRKEPFSEETSPMPDQILVCLSSRGPNSERLLRYASRFAGRLNKNWYALYVQSEAEDPLHIDTQTQISLSNAMTLAKQLGAIVFTYKGEDLASTIIRFAREYRIGHIIIGTPARLPLFKRLLLRKTLSERLVQEAKGINIIVMNTSDRKFLSDDILDKEAQKTVSKHLYLTDFLKENSIVVWEKIALKEEVLRELSHAAFGDDRDFDEIYRALILREKESSTFFNEGAAFPHLRLDKDISPKLALGIIPQGITDISTIKPVQLVFLIVTSNLDAEIQAKILATASKIARSQNLVQTITTTKNARKIFREIEKWETDFLGKRD